MASGKRIRWVVTLVAGWGCLAVAVLNWRNMVDVGVTFSRVLLAVVITLVGLGLLLRGSRAGKTGDPEARN
jgi:hypothetical protein